MTNKVVGYTNSDIHLTTLKEIILDERYLFIDTFKNEFTNFYPIFFYVYYYNIFAIDNNFSQHKNPPQVKLILQELR